MMPDTNGNFFPEVSIKNLWRCETCGYVWTTKIDAQKCDHTGVYVRVYGGYYNNGIHVGGSEHVFKAVRKDKIEVVD